MANTDFVCVIVIVIVHMASAVWFRYATSFHISLECDFIRMREKKTNFIFWLYKKSYTSFHMRNDMLSHRARIPMNSRVRLYSSFV